MRLKVLRHTEGSSANLCPRWTDFAPALKTGGGGDRGNESTIQCGAEVTCRLPWGEGGERDLKSLLKGKSVVEDENVDGMAKGSGDFSGSNLKHASPSHLEVGYQLMSLCPR